MYSTNAKDKSDSFQFVHGSCYIPVEILTIIYASSVAAFGISVEVYVLVVQAIVNAVLVSRTCHGSDETTSTIIWAVKLIILFPAVELCHRTFRKLPRYDDRFNSSARSMLRQALLIGTIIFAENLAGLRALYHATNVKLPHFCKYETSHCGIINLYEPLFGYGDDICLEDLSAYTAGREQIRLLRNFVLLNIASYSVFNKHFLKVNAGAKHLRIRILLIVFFVGLATSTPISYIDPLFLPTNVVYHISLLKVLFL